MEKIKSIRKGRIWLNVYKDRNGELALTIQKTFPSREGGWRRTQFLVPKYNDLTDLLKALNEFMGAQLGNIQEQGWSQ